MLEFEKDGHIYRWDGRIVLSVTQKLSRVGIKDDIGRWNSISGSEFIGDNISAIFGTEFHKIPELSLQGWMPAYSEEMAPWVNGWQKFMKDHKNLETVDIGEGMPAIEWRIYVEQYNYAMTLDWLCKDSKTGKYYLVDWKTSTQWKTHWWLQLAAYSKGVESKLKTKCYTMPVRIYRDGYEKRIHGPAEVKADFNKFLSINNVFSFRMSE